MVCINRNPEVSTSTKGLISTYDIIIILSRHVERIITMTYYGSEDKM
jgi:hypothetical protein